MAHTGKRRVLTLDEKKDIIRRCDEGLGARALGRILGIPESTVRQVYRKKDDILNSVNAYGSGALDSRSRICSLLVRTESILYTWIKQQESDKVPLPNKRVQNQAILFYKHVCQKAGVPKGNFKASAGWLARFLKRKGILQGKHIGENNSHIWVSVGLRELGGTMGDIEVVAENFIAGTFVPCKRSLDSYEPGTGRVWAKIPDSTKLEVDAAVTAAKRAFSAWSKLSYQQRGKYLLKVADIMESKLDEFAVAESRDQGKPVWLAKAMDIPRAVLNLRHFAQAVPNQLNTSSVQPEPGVMNYTTRDPIGVAGLISPWNLPLYLLTFKLGPALISGNTVVAKPSELTSVTAYMLCKVFQEADLPSGVVNMVFGTGKMAGEALVTHPDVPIISFTGSTLTGQHIAQAAAPMFKKISLEMGGKNAATVFSDCDLESCVATLKRASFINQGQVCLCTSRIFVQRPIYKEFLDMFVDAAKELKVGSPSDDGVYLGALNSKPHLEKVKRYVSYALEDGGTVVCGEGVDFLNLPLENKDGYYMRPTIITGLSDNSRCMQEEIFGPVTCVVPFDTEEEVIERANNTSYGLCASVWTSNLGVAHRVAHNLKVGTVWTNCWLIRDLNMPFGGVKGSGLGREGTHESLDFYTEVKTICTKI